MGSQGIRRITPSPLSGVDSPVAQTTSSSKRQLFGSTDPKTKGRDDVNEPTNNHLSPAQRRLFGLDGRPDRNHHISSSLRSDRSGIRERSPAAKRRKSATPSSAHGGKNNCLTSSTSSQPLMQGLTPWDSLASVTQSTGKSEGMATTRMSRDGKAPTAMEPAPAIPVANSIPPELVSLLAPKGLKWTKRLLQTHEEILKKAEGWRKKQVSPRKHLPRRCKSHHTAMSYIEESDDDLFFDDMRHSELQKEESKRTPIPSEVTTRSERSAPPPADSAPTDTNQSSTSKAITPQRSSRTAHGTHAGDDNYNLRPKRPWAPPPKLQRSIIQMETIPIKRKRGRPPKNKSTHNSSGTGAKETVVNPLPVKRKRGRPRKVRPVEDMTLVAAQHLPATSRRSLRPLRKVRQLVETKADEKIAHKKQHPATKFTRRRTNDQGFIDLPPRKDVDSFDKKTLRQSESPNPEEILVVDEEQGEVITSTTKTLRPIVKVKTKSRSSKHSTARTSRVRFAPNTTTFSLKIRVKTSAASSKKGKTHQTAAPTLSESTVQSIANQITQAYLAQDPSALAGTDHYAGEGDGSDDDDSDSESSCSSSDDDNGDDDDEEEEQQQEGPVVESGGGVEANRKGRLEELVADDNHDARSVASEITMDIDLIRGEHEQRISRLVFPVPEERHDFPTGCDTSVDDQKVTPSHDDDAEGGIPHEKEGTRGIRRAQWVTCRGSTVAGATTNHPLGTSFPTCAGANERTTQAIQRKRKRRVLRSTDSLAGFSLASINSIKSTGGEVPAEVSVNQSRATPDSRDNSASYVAPTDRAARADKRYPLESLRTENAPVVVGGIDETIEARRPKEVGTPHSLATNGRCGKCSGCRQRFDCLTCTKCIANLQAGIRCRQGMGCLKRICKGMAHQRRMDTLGRSSKPTGLESTLDVIHQEARQPGSAGLDPYIDDASVSYFSETGSIYSTASKRRRSRAARLWSRRWSKERRKMAAAQSVSSEHKASSVGVPVPKKRRTGARSKGKKAKSALHDLELPLPTDGSVTSMMEGRRSLRALMSYDEADQDWL